MTQIQKKYHFEGKRTDKKGNDVYVVIEIKTGKVLEWNEATFEKNKQYIEY